MYLPAYLRASMSHTEKSAYYQALKQAGVKFEKHYRDYSTETFVDLYNGLVAKGHQMPPINLGDDEPKPAEPAAPVDAEAAAFFGFEAPEPEPAAPPPVQAADPNELPGQRLNTKDEDEPIRTDEDGRVWYQEEVRKPAYPKPRGRRVLSYQNPGVVTKTVKSGDYTETFEVAGDMANAEPAQVKITLPSYQVGVYKDPRFPFKVITYNGNNGFDLREVQQFYGGAELVPAGVKRIYVENVLCYDIRTVIRAIEDEYRAKQLDRPIPQPGVASV